MRWLALATLGLLLSGQARTPETSGRRRTPRERTLLRFSPQVGTTSAYGAFGEPLSYTRAGKAWSDAAGTLVLHDANSPRVAPTGVLIEPASTNLIAVATGFSGWATNQATITKNATGPDGVANSAWTLTDNAVDNYHYVSTGLTGVASAAHTMSVYVKAGTANFVRWHITDSGGRGMAVNLATGEVISSYGSPTSATARAVGGGWYRLALTWTNATANITAVFVVGTTSGQVSGASPSTYAGSGSTILVFGAMIQTGSLATSLNDWTVGATRNADQLTYSTAGWPADGLEVSLTFTPYHSVAAQRTLFDTLSGGNGAQLAITAGGALQLKTALSPTTSTTASGALTWTVGRRYEIRARWRNGLHEVYRDGLLIASAGGTAQPASQGGTAHLGQDVSAANLCHGLLSNLLVRAF